MKRYAGNKQKERTLAKSQDTRCLQSNFYKWFKRFIESRKVKYMQNRLENKKLQSVFRGWAHASHKSATLNEIIARCNLKRALVY